MEMDVVYFNKAGSRVTRVVNGDWVEVEVPGYKERYFVELSDVASVGPPPLTTLKAEVGSTGDLYLSTTYLFNHRIAGDLDSTKWPQSQGGSFARFWRYLNSPARTPAIADAIAGVRAHVEARGASVRSRPDQEALVRSVREEPALNERLRAAFPHPEPADGKHLDRVAASLVTGVVCGALR